MRFALRVFIACVAPALLLAEQPSKDIRVRFSPPDGCTYVQEHSNVRDIRVPGKPADVRNTSGKSRFEVRKDGEGYEIRIIALEASATRNGQSVPDPISMGLMNTPVVLKLDRQGSVQAIEGVKEMISAVLSKVPEGARDNVKRVVTPESIADKFKNDWEGTTLRFTRLEGSPGVAWTSEDSVPGPGGGVVRFTSLTTLRAVEPCGRSTCALFEIEYSSLPGDAATAVAKMHKELGKQPPSESGVDLSIKGQASYTIDLYTGLIHSGKTNRTIRQSDREGIQATLVESRDVVATFENCFPE